MNSMVNCIFAMIMFLLLGIPSNALALHYTMDFDATDLKWTNSYDEEGFLVTATDYRPGRDGFFVGSGSLRKVNPSRVEEVLFTHFIGNDHNLPFDLVSLDIVFLMGESIITSSSGESLLLSDFDMGTANFNTDGW